MIIIKWKVDENDEMANRWSGESTKWQICVTANWQTHWWNDKVTKQLVYKIANWQNGKLTKQKFDETGIWWNGSWQNNNVICEQVGEIASWCNNKLLK